MLDDTKKLSVKNVKVYDPAMSFQLEVVSADTETWLYTGPIKASAVLYGSFEGTEPRWGDLPEVRLPHGDAAGIYHIYSESWKIAGGTAYYAIVIEAEIDDVRVNGFGSGSAIVQPMPHSADRL